MRYPFNFVYLIQLTVMTTVCAAGIALEHLGGIASEGDLRDLQIEGSLAYLADRQNGMVIVDVSDPAEPIVLSRFNTIGHALFLNVHQGYAYIGMGDDGLQIVDIKDPERPTSVDHFIIFQEVQFPDEPEPLTARTSSSMIEIIGSTMYVYGQICNGFFSMASFNILSIDEPTIPSVVSQYAELAFGIGRLVVTEVRAYLTLKSFGVVGMVVLDIHDPSNLSMLGALAIDENGPSGGFMEWNEAESIIMVAYKDPGTIHFIDVSDPEALEILNSYPTGTDSAFNMVLTGRYLLLAAGTDGIMVLDVSDPLNPEQLLLHQTVGEAFEMKLVGDLLYVAEQDAGFQIYRVSGLDPNSAESRWWAYE